MWVKKQQLELDKEKLASSKLLSPYLFTWYDENIMQNAELGESQAGIKIAGRNINNLRYAQAAAAAAKSLQSCPTLCDR